MNNKMKLLWGAYAALVAAFAVMLLVIPSERTFVFWTATVGTALACVVAGICGGLRLKKQRILGVQPAWPGEFTLLAVQLLFFAFLDMGSVFCPKYIAVVAELIIWIPMLVVTVGEERLRDAVRWLYARRKKVIALVVSVIIAVPALYFAIPFARYEWAQRQLEKGEFARAAENFAALGDYSDADRRRQESLYCLGREINEAGDAEGAYFVLCDILKYDDVRKYIEEDPELTAVREKYAAYDEGNQVEFGTWNGAPLQWHVLDQKGSMRMLFVTEPIAQMAYNDEFEIIDWENCSLRAWLNSEFMNEAFDAGEQARIQETAIKNDDNAMYRVEAGDDTVDRVFLLSIDEAEMYRAEHHSAFKYSTSWLRSPGCSRIDAAVVTHGGGVDEMGSNIHHDHYAVRPVLWIDIAE